MGARAVDVRSDDSFQIVDPVHKRICSSGKGNVHRTDSIFIRHEAVLMALAVRVIPHDSSRVIESICESVNGSHDIDWLEAALLKQEAMLVAGGVAVISDNLLDVVDAPQPGIGPSGIVYGLDR